MAMATERTPFWMLVAAGATLAGAALVRQTPHGLTLTQLNGELVTIDSKSVVILQDDVFVQHGRRGTQLRLAAGENYRVRESKDQVLSIIDGLASFNAARPPMGIGDDSTINVRISAITAVASSTFRRLGREERDTMIMVAGRYRVLVRNPLAEVQRLVGRR